MTLPELAQANLPLVILAAAVIGVLLGWWANGTWRRGRVEQRAAFTIAADWLAQCRHCGREHIRRPDPQRPHMSTWVDPGDGHGYWPRDRQIVEQLRQAADDEEAWT